MTLWGEVVRDPARDVAAGAPITVDGKPLAGPQRRVVYALNKPVGVLSTASDPYGRPTVLRYVEEGERRLYPVGRLDRDSAGLIFITNDGELAYALTHPRFEVEKAYDVTVRGGPVSEQAVRKLRAGVVLEDGKTAPAQVTKLGPRRLRITIHEGRNRQVRRMCAAVGHPVSELMRVRFGPLELGGLHPGSVRKLTRAEVDALRAAANADGGRAASV